MENLDTKSSLQLLSACPVLVRHQTNLSFEPVKGPKFSGRKEAWKWSVQWFIVTHADFKRSIGGEYQIKILLITNTINYKRCTFAFFVSLHTFLFNELLQMRELHWCLLLIILQVGNPIFCLKQQMPQQLCGAQPSLRGTAPWIPLSPTTVSGVVYTRLLPKIPFVDFISDVSLLRSQQHTHCAFLVSTGFSLWTGWRNLLLL